MSKSEFEGYVLSSIMMAPKGSQELIEAMLKLKSDWFEGLNKDIFNKAQELFNKDVEITPDSIMGDLNSEAFLLTAQHSQLVNTHHNLLHYVDRLEEENNLQALKRYHEQCVSLFNATNLSSKDKLQKLREMPAPNFIQTQAETGKPVPELLKEFILEYEKDYQEGEKTGFDNLDTLLHTEGNGIKNGSLVVVTGGTKQGKSALATSIFANRLTDDTSSLCFTMEISGLEFIQNLLAQKAKVSRNHFIKKDKSEHVLKRMSAAIGQIGKNKNNIIYDTENMTLDFIVQMSRLQAKKTPIKTIIVDYLTLIKRPNVYAQPHEDWGYCVKTLRQLAKELDCVLLLLSQVNREASKRKDPRPLMTDVRDTSQLQYDCHLMLGTFVDKRSIEGQPKQMEVNIMLNRNGPAHQVAYFDFEGGNLREKTKQEGIRYNELIGILDMPED